MIGIALILTAFALLRFAAKPKKKARRAVKQNNAVWEDRCRYLQERLAKEDAQPTPKEAARAEREAEKQRKAEAERQQAAADRDFCIGQLDKLNAMLWELDEELNKANEVCQHDAEMNRHGAVIAEKIVNKHRADRDKLARKVMQLENAIHAKETKLNKALLIAGA